jgi:hypothetical protein
MRSALETLYPDRSSYKLSICDIRSPGAAERLHRERAAWQEQSEIKATTKDHFLFVVYAGGAQRLAC